MVKSVSARTARLVLILCTLLASGWVAAIAAPGASAGPLEVVTGPVNEAVGLPLTEGTETATAPEKELTETVTGPVEEVGETVTQPVQEVTGTVIPPVRQVTETVARPANGVVEHVPQPVKGAPDAVKQAVKQLDETVAAPRTTAQVAGATAPAVHTATGTIGSSSRSAAKNAGTSVRDVTATHTAGDTVGGAGHPIGRGPSPSSSVPDLGPGEDTFEVSSRDGSVRAPLRRWLAYVWPAIALTDPALADFLGGWKSQGLNVAPGTSGGFGVAGVHASSGRMEHRNSTSSSSPPFSKIASALGHLPSDGPGEALAYIVIVAIMLIVLFTAARWEIVRGRREGRG
jgi:hypothetical protein